MAVVILKKTHEQYVSEVYAKYGDEYEVISRYTSSKARIKLRHKVCGAELDRVAQNVTLKGVQCPCLKKKPTKWTKEAFLSVMPEEFELLSEYTSAKDKATFKHIRCGRVWETMPYLIIKGYGCKPCAMKSFNSTHKEIVFREKLKKRNGKFTLVGLYENAHAKTDFKCKDCGGEFVSTPDKVINSRISCPLCGTRRSWSTKQFNSYVHNVTEGEYELVGEYTKLHDKHTFKHKVCGKTFECEANSFKNGQRCSHCLDRGAWHRVPYEKFLDRLRQAHGDDITLLSPYTGYRDSIRVTSESCGHVWISWPQNLAKGHGCHECARMSIGKSNRLSHEEFAEFVEKEGRGDYVLLSDYETTEKPVEFLHKSCGRTYTTRPATFRSGSRCPHCAASKGEVAVRLKLLDIGLKFEEQATFDDLKYKNKLRFDFAVYSRDNVYCVIEYDGKHHYEEIPYFKENFELTKKRDAIKNEYCRKNNIPLIRIPYWEFDNGTLETFLEAELNKLGISKIAN